MDTTDFSKLFEDAEKAVSGIKNDKLKEIAFDKLVSHLLSGSSGNSNDNKIDDAKPKRVKSKRKSSKTSSGKQSKNKT